MTDKIKSIIEKHTKASNLKETWNSKYEEISKYIIPSKFNYDKNSNGKFKDDDIELFTSVGINSANNFVNRIQSIITPINSDFIGLEAGDFRPDKEEQDRNLEKLCKLLNNFKNASNFDTVISEFYYELVLGTACLLIDGGGYDTPLVFKVIPFKDYSITESYNGNVDGVFRILRIKPSLIKYTWSDSSFEMNEEQKKEDIEIELLESVLYNYEKKIYNYYLIDKKEQKSIVEREYKTNPFIILRWGKTAGEIYGRGIALNAINDVKTLNKIMEYSLRSFAFNIPTFLAQEDNFFNFDNFTLEPGAVNKVTSTAINNPSVIPLQVNTNHDITSYNSEKMAMDIKRSMMDSTIPDDPNNTTATEINRRVQELNINLTSMFGRIINDFLIPFTKRTIEVLQGYGFINTSLDISVIDGYGYKIKINTPLAKQNKQAELDASLYSIQTIMSLDNTGQILNQFVKTNELIPYLLDLAGMPNRFIKTQQEIQEEQEQQQIEQQQMQAQQMQNEVLLSNEIEAGKQNAKQQ